MEWEKTLNWYMWVLRWNPKRYLALLLMTAGPLYYIYKFVFLTTNVWELFIGLFGTFIAGLMIWAIAWDPEH